MVKDNIIPNHMDIYWHDYTGHVKDKPITEASVPVKAALIGRVGLMLLSCGTGAWRVRSAMNLLSESMGVTCTASIGLMTIVYTEQHGSKHTEAGQAGTLCKEISKRGSSQIRGAASV